MLAPCSLGGKKGQGQRPLGQRTSWHRPPSRPERQQGWQKGSKRSDRSTDRQIMYHVWAVPVKMRPPFLFLPSLSSFFSPPSLGEKFGRLTPSAGLFVCYSGGEQLPRFSFLSRAAWPSPSGIFTSGRLCLRASLPPCADPSMPLWLGGAPPRPAVRKMSNSELVSRNS